jgi:hypothetical protein
MKGDIRRRPWDVSRVTWFHGENLLMAAVGLYRCPGNPPWVCLLEDAKGSYVAENHYREGGYQPDFDALPWESDYRAAKEKGRTTG